MNPILKTHTRKQIADICGVNYNTVLNWIKLDTIPLSAINRLGFDIKTVPEYMETGSELEEGGKISSLQPDRITLDLTGCDLSDSLFEITKPDIEKMFKLLK